MVGLSALWNPIVVSAVFVLIALSLIHAILGWHKGDMTAIPVGVMSISPSAPINMGKMFGQWFVYSLVIAVLAAYITGRTHGLGAPLLEVFRVSGAVAFCCYVVALWQNWIWWGQSTRFTVTNSLDGIIFALITGATFGWL
ncbi:MAG: hypothetical protein M3081_18140 [Gemmatimonadota bacterium]|nr:hypothetical protein [Gemmatimonadota bacterium]